MPRSRPYSGPLASRSFDLTAAAARISLTSKVATCWETMRDLIEMLPHDQRHAAWAEIHRRSALQVTRTEEAAAAAAHAASQPPTKAKGTP